MQPNTITHLVIFILSLLTVTLILAMTGLLLPAIMIVFIIVIITEIIKTLTKR
jgi:hypothetical protein